MLRWTWGWWERSGYRKGMKTSKTSGPAGDFSAELTGMENPGLNQWRSGKMNLKASCIDQCSQVKWLHRNWGEEGRFLDWTNLLGGMNKAILENTSKPTLFTQCFLPLYYQRVEWGCRGKKKILLYVRGSNCEPYHLLILKFSSLSFFFPQWQYPRAILDRITQWQIVLSKDGHNNCFNRTSSSLKVTLTIFPLSCGVFSLSPWTWVDPLLLHLKLVCQMPGCFSALPLQIFSSAYIFLALSFLSLR